MVEEYYDEQPTDEEIASGMSQDAAARSYQEAALKPDFSSGWQDESVKDFNRYQLDDMPFVDEIKRNFQGLVPNEKGELVLDPKLGTRMNDIGVNDIISFLSVITNRNAILTFIQSEEMVYRQISGLILQFNDALIINFYRWGLKEEDIPLLSKMAEKIIHDACWRAWKGKTFDGLNKPTRRIEQTMLGSQPQRPQRRKFGI